MGFIEIVTTDEKWQVVREYYEASYKIKFQCRPSETRVDFLFEEMQKLKEALRRHQDGVRKSIRKWN